MKRLDDLYQSSADARELIISLRGRPPAACCGCGEEKPESDMHPVSGGEWLCLKCYEETHE